MNSVESGALAGLLATVPMTGVMIATERMLWPTAKPLVHKQIVRSVAQKADIGAVSRTKRNAAAWIAHFGYGMTTGAMYALVPRAPCSRTVAQGAMYGLFVWAASYLGWLPAADILPPATRQSQRRNVSLVASHVVWGATTAVLFTRFFRK